MVPKRKVEILTLVHVSIPLLGDRVGPGAIAGVPMRRLF